jgi:phospholipase C
MPPGLDNLKHIVVLMMENRSFDHMLGALRSQNPQIDGLTGNETNPDNTGAAIAVQPLADFQGQLDPDPDHHFPAVNQQLFNGSSASVPNMQGFINNYFQQQRDTSHSQKIMYYFAPDKLPVLTTLASQFVMFNRWHASIPGPTICNRAFAHYGTSFGNVGMDIFYANAIYLSVYQRMQNAGRTAKIYYYDQASSTMEVVNLLQKQPQFFGTFDQFVSDCQNGTLPDYSFIEPNYSDHEGDGGELLASDQHPDHNVQAGEVFMAEVYNKIRENPQLWQSTALLVLYDEHGGIFDHVPPPVCIPDGFVAQPKDTGTGQPFYFDRLGVRVPAVLISPWVPKGLVVSPLEADGTIAAQNLRVFEHACIPATVTGHFIPNFDQNNKRSPREQAAQTFLDLLSLPEMRTDDISFDLS